MEHKFLISKFIELMNDIGQYGEEKYKDQSFAARALKGDKSRGYLGRTQPYTIANHAKEHYDEYLNGKLHDYFQTRGHQLAAVAFNAMMEFYFADLENEKKNTRT